MSHLRLTAHADLGVIFDALRRRCSDEKWEKVTAGGKVTKEIFIADCSARNLPTLGFECDGKPIGGLVFDGEAAHLEVLPAYHGRWGLLWKPALAWIFSHKDPILVDIDADNHKCLRFMDRNNFPRMKETADHVTYRMSSDAPPHDRKQQRRIRAAAVSPATASG